MFENQKLWRVTFREKHGACRTVVAENDKAALEKIREDEKRDGLRRGDWTLYAVVPHPPVRM